MNLRVLDARRVALMELVPHAHRLAAGYADRNPDIALALRHIADRLHEIAKRGSATALAALYGD